MIKGNKKVEEAQTSKLELQEEPIEEDELEDDLNSGSMFAVERGQNLRSA